MATVELDIPTLAPGDNLTREEFLRIWSLHPEIKKAELIGGIVYMSSPVSLEHGVADNGAGIWVGNYCVATPGTQAGNNTTSYLCDDTPQPDLFLRILETFGGKSWPEGTFLAGSPEMLLEISRSSAAYDLHQKFELYEAAGVAEYLAILLFEKEIRWHILREGRYQLLAPDADGVHRSLTFPGLWLDGPAFLQNDMTAVLATLRKGIATVEHEQFVKDLARKKRG